MTGFLADVGDVETMARYAVDLLSDESALRAMGKRARAGASEKFCSSKIIPLYSSGLGRMGSRNRINVPPPSRLSIIILAVSP